MISMMEAYAISIGTVNQQRALIQLEERPIIKSCAIFDCLKKDENTWVRSDDYLDRKLQMSLTHTVCPACLAHHYPALLEQEADFNLRIR
jgi:hypothetical protein